MGFKREIKKKTLEITEKRRVSERRANAARNRRKTESVRMKNGRKRTQSLLNKT